MEQEEKQFDAVLKKSVAMYSMLTGKKMTEREGRAFIEIFDMTESYIANGSQAGSAAETFDILSHVDPITQIKERAAEYAVRNPPQFLGRELGDPIEAMTNEEKARAEVYVDRAGPEADTTAVAVMADDRPVTVLKHAAVPLSHELPILLDGGPGKTAKPRYTPPPIHTHDRDHIPGYDWQICVLSRLNDKENSYIIHFAERPTQDVFAEHYIKFQRQTHYVHVNEWIDRDWVGITKTYDTSSVARKSQSQEVVRVVHSTAAPQKIGRDVSVPSETADWEQDDKPWRIRYYSPVTGAVIFHYCDKRPSGAEMAHFHHSKCMAISQAKPKPEASA